MAHSACSVQRCPLLLLISSVCIATSVQRRCDSSTACTCQAYAHSVVGLTRASSVSNDGTAAAAVAQLLGVVTHRSRSSAATAKRN
jgi:hypothetical protein